MIEAALFQHILKPHIAQLFVPRHSAQSPLVGHGIPSAAKWKAIEMPWGQPSRGRTARRAGTVVQPISERDGVVTYLQSGCQAKLNKEKAEHEFLFEMGGFRDCDKVKHKSNRAIAACRLDKRDREELEARAEMLNTTVGDLVEKYVLAGLRVDRSGEIEQRSLFKMRGFFDLN